MPSDVVVLVATAVLAAVAVVAAVVAVRASRRAGAAVPAVRQDAMATQQLDVSTPAEGDGVHREGPAAVVRTGTELEPRVVEGRVVVPPTGDQVVAAAMGRPRVRMSVLVHGLAHALRPESRDRMAALMRREYRARRRERLRAGRRAARSTLPAQPTPSADRWMGAQRPDREVEA